MLDICKQHEGDKICIEKAIKEAFFSNKTNYVERLASNCRLGLQCYEILDANCELTDIGNQLLSIGMTINCIGILLSISFFT